jgi:hypothetical protein
LPHLLEIIYAAAEPGITSLSVVGSHASDIDVVNPTERQRQAALLQSVLSSFKPAYKNLVADNLRGLLERAATVPERAATVPERAATVPERALLGHLLDIFARLSKESILERDYNFQFCALNFLASTLTMYPMTADNTLLQFAADHLHQMLKAASKTASLPPRLSEQLVPGWARQFNHLNLVPDGSCLPLQVQLIVEFSAALLRLGVPASPVDALVLRTPLLLNHISGADTAVTPEMLENVSLCLHIHAARPEPGMIFSVLSWARTQLEAFNLESGNSHPTLEVAVAEENPYCVVAADAVLQLALHAFSAATLEQVKEDTQERREQLHRIALELLGFLDADSEKPRQARALIARLVELASLLTREDNNLLVHIISMPAVVKTLLACTSCDVLEEDPLLAQRAAALLASAALLAGSSVFAAQGCSKLTPGDGFLQHLIILQHVFQPGGLACSKALLQSTWLADHHNFSALLLSQLAFATHVGTSSLAQKAVADNDMMTSTAAANGWATASRASGDESDEVRDQRKLDPPGPDRILRSFIDAVASYASPDHPTRLPLTCVDTLLTNLAKALEVPSLSAGLFGALRANFDKLMPLMAQPEASTAAAAGRLVALAAGLSSPDANLIAETLQQPGRDEHFATGNSASSDVSTRKENSIAAVGKFTFAVEEAARKRLQDGIEGQSAPPPPVSSARLVALAGLLRSPNVSDPMALLREHLRDTDWDIVGEQISADKAAAAVTTPDMDNTTSMVMTVTAQRNVTKVEDAIAQRCPLLLSGPTGVGKSATVAEVARRHGRKLLRVNMSSRMTEQDLLGHLELHTDPQTGKEDLVFVMFQVS